MIFGWVSIVARITTLGMFKKYFAEHGGVPRQEVFVYSEVSIFDLSNRRHESQIGDSSVSDTLASQLSQMRKRSGNAGGVETQYSRAKKIC
jgi:hypothetical protein